MAELITHGCGKQWTGLSRCHCGGCHETFSSLTAFDAHQNRPGSSPVCRNPALSGLVPTEYPWGTCWGLPGHPPERSHG